MSRLPSPSSVSSAISSHLQPPLATFVARGDRPGQAVLSTGLAPSTISSPTIGSSFTRIISLVSEHVSAQSTNDSQYTSARGGVSTSHQFCPHTGLISLSRNTADLVAAHREQDLLQAEVRQSFGRRQAGLQLPRSSALAGIDGASKRALTTFIREHKLSIADTVRLFRHETERDSRPNKALVPARLKLLLRGYPLLSTLLQVAEQGITPSWKHLKAAVKSVRKGQDNGQFLVVDADILDLWDAVRCSPLGAVEKGDVDPSVEVRLIHDLSFPAGSSTNDLLDKDCLPEVLYAYVTVLATRIEYLAARYPGVIVKILKGDAKGVYRHLMTNANHVHHMAGLIPEHDALGIDHAAPFGWAGSSQFYGAFGGAISWLVSENSPASVSNPTDDVPFFGYEWVDDHVMIEIDNKDRLQLAEATLRLAMLAVLGPRSINEEKFSSWETRLTVLGLTWDTSARTLSIPADKIQKGIDRISKLLRAGAATRTDLQKIIGSLRYIATCIRTAKPFFQQLHTASVRWRRFGRLPLPSTVIADLRWFEHILRFGHLAELPLCMFGSMPEPDINLYMDASDMGLAVLNLSRDEFIQVRFDSEEIIQIREGLMSINVREYLCIALAIWTWGACWSSQTSAYVRHVRCWSDNTSAVSWNNRLASSCLEAQEINRAIGLGEAIFNIRISAAHLPGATNRMADAASRAWTEPHASVWSNFSVNWSQSESLASSSVIKYTGTWQHWTRWCETMQFSPWLLQSRAQHSYRLALFAVYCWRYGFGRPGQGNSASTIMSKISHISWNHQFQLGFSVGLLPGHKLAIVGMRRHDKPSSKKHPITTNILQALHRSLDFSCTQDRVLWGAAVLGYFYLLRRSAYLATGRRTRYYALTRADISVMDGQGRTCTRFSTAAKCTVRFRGSKSDQFGEGTTRTLARPGLAWCCPVEAAWFLCRHHERIGAAEDSLMCQVSSGNMLQAGVVAAALKGAAASIGEDPARFGSHSLRSGGATALFNAGVDYLAVKMFGRWKSEAVERYTALKSELTSSLAQQMVSKHH